MLLDDLAKYLKTGKSPQAKHNENEELSKSENELRFSYWFPDDLKLNQFDHKAKLDRNDQNRVSEEQCNINKQLGDDQDKFELPQISGHHNSTANLEEFLQKEGYSKNQSQNDSTNQSPSKLLNLMQTQSNQDDQHNLSNSRENKFWNPVESNHSETYGDEIEDVSDEVQHQFELKINNSNNDKSKLFDLNSKLIISNI